MGTTPSKGEKGVKRDPNKAGIFTTLKPNEVIPDEYKVTVISTGEKKAEEDPILAQLAALKVPPRPLLESANKKRYVTDSFNFLQILSAYQQVLHHSSKNVAENQEALVTKIPPAASEAQRNMQFTIKTFQELSYLESQLRTIYEMENAVQYAQDQLIHIVSFLDQLESLIPEEFTQPPTPVKLNRDGAPTS